MLKKLAQAPIATRNGFPSIILIKLNLVITGFGLWYGEDVGASYEIDSFIYLRDMVRLSPYDSVWFSVVHNKFPQIFFGMYRLALGHSYA